MKAIFVESSNGYMARSSDDDMLWTTTLDKKIFKLLTHAYGGVCVCSRNTYNLLPKKMLNDPQRNFIIATRFGQTTLRGLNKLYPDAVLIGGPAFLNAAYNEGVIDTFIVTTVNRTIKNNARYENPFIDTLLKLDAQCEIAIGELTIRVYYNEYKY